MDPYTSQIKSLQDVYGDWNPLGNLAARDLLDQGRQYADQQSLEQQLKNAQTQKMNPLILEEQRLRNETSQAQLPGITANSSLLTDKAKLSKDSMKEQFENLIAEYQGKMNKKDLDFINGGASAYSQAGQALTLVPPNIRHQMGKRMLGSFWQPEFDSMDPETLGKTLSTMGEYMTMAQSKFAQQSALQAQKGEDARALAATKSAQQLALAQYKASVSRAVSDAKKTGNKGTLKNTQDAIYNELRREIDPDKRKALQEEFNNITRIISDMEVRARVAGNAGKPDVTSLGFKEQGLPSAPSLGNNPVVQPSTGSPAQGRPQSLADLQKLYPGVPPEKLKEAFKKKFGIDIK